MLVVHIAPHPLVFVDVFETRFVAPMGVSGPGWLAALLTLNADVPVSSQASTKEDVRALLRFGGYKPAGRGKPASEFLLRAHTQGTLASINLAVDACNVVSLHSGLPISVVDLDRIEEPLRIAIAAPDASYVFNRSGQEIELKGLLCLHDREGPCANAVKDSQRTKTSEHTRRTLSVVWGTRSLREQTLAAGAWYRQLLARAEASTLDCETRASESSPQSD